MLERSLWRAFFIFSAQKVQFADESEINEMECLIQALSEVLKVERLKNFRFGAKAGGRYHNRYVTSNIQNFLFYILGS